MNILYRVTLKTGSYLPIYSVIGTKVVYVPNERRYYKT